MQNQIFHSTLSCPFLLVFVNRPCSALTSAIAGLSEDLPPPVLTPYGSPEFEVGRPKHGMHGYITCKYIDIYFPFWVIDFLSLLFELLPYSLSLPLLQRFHDDGKGERSRRLPRVENLRRGADWTSADVRIDRQVQAWLHAWRFSGCCYYDECSCTFLKLL